MGKRLSQLNQVDQINREDYFLVDGENYPESKKVKIKDIKIKNFDTSELEEEINAKQDELKSGQNIKTINGQSILGEGNIEIEGGGSGGGDTPANSVLYVEQTLTEGQKSQARTNIGALGKDETPKNCVSKSDILSVISYDNYVENDKPVNTFAVINYTQRELGNYLTRTNLAQIIGDGEISAAQILYNVDVDNRMTIKEKVDYIEGTIGDIDSLLEELHNYAQTLIGGEA